MAALTLLTPEKRAALLKRALFLALITIVYNSGEALASIFFGVKDETVSLFGFGVDSVIEVISGAGIYHMIRRMMRHTDGDPDRFERTALKVTGTAFYILTVGLVISAAFGILEGKKPETTFWGVVISLVSIFTMWLLIRMKVDVGRKLNSQAILADAACTRTCLNLSFVLLISSAGYELTGIGWFDSVGALLIAYLSFKEGREAFNKAKGGTCGCGGVCAS